MPFIQFIFGLWPVIFLGVMNTRPTSTPNLSMIERSQSALLRVIVLWGVWAALRLSLFLSQKEPVGIIPEPANSLIFFITGLVIMILLAGFKIWKQYQQHLLLRSVRALEDLQRLSPEGFEKLTAEMYRALGHEVKRVGATGDHGVDLLVFTPRGEKIVVQCKRWKGQVGEPVIRDLYGVMYHEQADRAALVTTGGFSVQARSWAAEKPITLIDGETLVKTLRRVQSLKKRKS